ncbi:MAG: outer membrane beta-barrel protein [Balneolaceae bacterium]|nr:outer membrane beta-barrel protein [Balneolaceae bacterium]
MKTTIRVLVLFAVIFSFTLQTSKAQVTAGAGMAFGADIEQVGIQGDLHYRLSGMPSIHFGGGFTYYFPKDNHDFYEINLNGAYTFYEEFMFRSYAFTGLNYARSKTAHQNASVSDSAFGLNAGIGAEYDFGRLRAFGELKYVISEFDQAVFTIGLRVPF